METLRGEEIVWVDMLDRECDSFILPWAETSH